MVVHFLLDECHRQGLYTVEYLEEGIKPKNTSELGGVFTTPQPLNPSGLLG